jgi:hypothetical protein
VEKWDLHYDSGCDGVDRFKYKKFSSIKLKAKTRAPAFISTFLGNIYITSSLVCLLHLKK